MSDAWKMVKCSRCGREHLCTPSDDHYEPADHLGWTEGKVCQACLMALSVEAKS